MATSFLGIPNQNLLLVANPWLTERQRHGSPGSAIPGAAAPSF